MEAIKSKRQFIVNTKGKRTAVLLPIKEYERMLEALEDAEDIRLYDEAKADPNQTYIPFDQIVAEIEARRKVRD